MVMNPGKILLLDFHPNCSRKIKNCREKLKMLRQDDKDALDSFSEKLSENLPKTFSKKHPLGKLQR